MAAPRDSIIHFLKVAFEQRQNKIDKIIQNMGYLQQLNPKEKKEEDDSSDQSSNSSDISYCSSSSDGLSILNPSNRRPLLNQSATNSRPVNNDGPSLPPNDVGFVSQQQYQYQQNQISQAPSINLTQNTHNTRVNEQPIQQHSRYQGPDFNMSRFQIDE